MIAAAALASCVSVENLPDPRGALKPGQRVVVSVYPSPGPWIIDAPDNKAETAAKVSPLGFVMENVQNSHILSVSRNLQPYLPRPHLHEEMTDELMKALRTRIPSTAVQGPIDAGIAPLQLANWNTAKDQLDWRLRYYAPDPSLPSPRDYARLLSLDDAIILDVNMSFGTTATDDGALQPQLSANSRAYRGDTMHLIWEHEDEVVDKTSSATLTDIQMQPSDLTNRWERLAPALGDAVAASFVKAFGLAPSTSTAAGLNLAAPASSGGLVPMSVFQNNPSTGTTPAPTIPPPATTPPPSLSPPAVSTTTR